MRKTRAEMDKCLLDFFGLKFGDRIMISTYGNKIFKVKETLQGNTLLIDIEDEFNIMYIQDLYNEEYEIIAGPKRIGDRHCGENTTHSDCLKCPLYGIDCAEGHHEPDGGEEETIYYTLDCWAEYYGYSKDHPIYLAFKAELDKEGK